MHHYIFINKTYHFNFYKTPIISTSKSKLNRKLVKYKSTIYTLFYNLQSTVTAKITNKKKERIMYQSSLVL